MTGNKQFKLHIEWYNQEKTEGEFVLKDGGQPLGVIESIEDARLIRDTLNELYYDNEKLKQMCNDLVESLDEEIISFNNNYSKLKKECIDLLNENEQLKQQINLLKLALCEELQDNGNAFFIRIFDDLFGLNYDEWESKHEYPDWEEILKNKKEYGE